MLISYYLVMGLILAGLCAVVGTQVNRYKIMSKKVVSVYWTTLGLVAFFYIWAGWILFS